VIGTWGYEQFISPKMEAVREQRSFAEAIRILAPNPQEILLFRVESHLLAYHLGRPINTLVEWGELQERLQKPGAHYFVTRAEFAEECMEKLPTQKMEVVLRSEMFSSAKPLRPLALMRTTPKTD
jgi:hypothetical protein